MIRPSTTPPVFVRRTGRQGFSGVEKYLKYLMMSGRRLRGNVVDALKNFQDFKTKLNTAKRLPRIPEREEE